jgi:hydrogenase nickel incorporation protein HypB
MCTTCGCGQPDSLLTKVLLSNEDKARHNRQHLDQAGVIGINLMASPGAGKTTLIEATISAGIPFGVIEGDLAEDIDTQRLQKKQIPCVQITTQTVCHLDAQMVHQALHHLPLDRLELLFIENIGNLVCPKDFTLGEHHRVVLLSVPEGDDKIEKYAPIFASADAIVITKIDLLPFFDFDMRKAKDSIASLAPNTQCFAVEAATEEGIEAWQDWLKTLVPEKALQ